MPAGSLDAGGEDPRRAAVDEEFGAGDEARIIGSEENGGLGDLLGLADAAGRNLAGEIVEQAFLIGFVRAGQVDEARRMSRAGADDVDPDVAVLEVEDPASGEIAHRRLRGAVDAEGRRALAA